ncbi:peptidyl-tRNA hydrolase, PTH2 family, partial [Lecanoromycetidae sp. Uapishka_2]
MTSFPDRPPPSITSYVVATGILCVSLGYFIGQASSLGLFSSKTSKKAKTSWPNNYDVAIHPDSSDEELMTHIKKEGVKVVQDSEDEDEDEDSENDSMGQDQGELRNFEGNREECKLVLVVRTDLGMGKGKMAAQCSHATLACYKYFLSHAPASPLLRRWESLGQAKVALQIPSEEQMDELQAKAMSMGLCAQVIHDAGRTQIASGSATVLGIGPGPKSVIDGITGHLRLL